MAISKAREDREKLCILDMPSVVGRPNTEIPERSKEGAQLIDKHYARAMAEYVDI